jgi:hypothetical protein
VTAHSKSGKLSHYSFKGYRWIYIKLIGNFNLFTLPDVSRSGVIISATSCDAEGLTKKRNLLRSNGRFDEIDAVELSPDRSGKPPDSYRDGLEMKGRNIGKYYSKDSLQKI